MITTLLAWLFVPLFVAYRCHRSSELIIRETGERWFVCGVPVAANDDGRW